MIARCQDNSIRLLLIGAKARYAQFRSGWHGPCHTAVQWIRTENLVSIEVDMIFSKMCSMISFWYCCLIGRCSSNRKSFSNQRDEPSYTFLRSAYSSVPHLAHGYLHMSNIQVLVASCLTTHQIKNAIRTMHIQALRPPFNSTPLRCVK